MLSLSQDGPGLLVKPSVASEQLSAETNKDEKKPDDAVVGPHDGDGTGPEDRTDPSPRLMPRRYYGTVTLDAARVGRDAGRIAEEVIAHLSALMGSQVKVTLEIEAEMPSGSPDNVVRTVTENGRTLKFTNQGFERD